MKKVLLLLFVVINTITTFAQLEVKPGSFKEVHGFVNIDPDKQTDDNDQPYSVIKVKTENINDKQRRELSFKGDAQTFFELEYRDGEVWIYISYYASFLKISHPDLSSTEFVLPFDMKPKCGYEITLVNNSVDDELARIRARLEELENNNVNKTTPTKLEPTGANIKSGKFSISPSKQVMFSQGNLQYQPYSDTWRFAEQQWDIIGAANENMSLSYNGWIDLFGWGSGKNPMSNDGNDSFMDWGNYFIINGVGKNWQTLTKDEWEFVLERRITNSGIRFAKAKVNGINGIILLPDNWKNSVYNLNKINTAGASYSVNIISQKDWVNLFESYGAVFLPSAGYRLGSSVSGVGSLGVYWSATRYDNHRSYYVNFSDGYFNTTLVNYHNGGQSVRLVCDAE